MRFYTNPRGIAEYPYLLVKMTESSRLFTAKFKHAIVDSGVMIFVKKTVTDYPADYIAHYGEKARSLNRELGEKVWVVIPDYPDDYNPGQFGDNVEKTINSVKKFFNTYPDVSWLPVIQSRYMDRSSFFESCKRTKDIIGDYPRVAIGTVCKCRNLKFITYCARVARIFFPHAWIHAFGMALNAIPHVAGIIDSFDSMAWTFPRVPGHSSAKNKGERRRYFQEYLERVRSLLNMYGAPLDI